VAVLLLALRTLGHARAAGSGTASA